MLRRPQRRPATKRRTVADRAGHVVDDAGRVRGATFVHSPNCDQRPDGAVIRLVVIHGISLPPGEFRRDGALLQFVPCTLRAWHAGASCWNGLESCNDFSIGIELEGTDDTPYAPMQYRTLASLLRALRARYPIEDVVGHSDVAPGRKTDPGPAFDWTRIDRAPA